MRKVIFAINISLDGCCDHTKFNPDDETLDYFTGLTQDADTFIYGRKTYELMVPYWPDIANNPSGQTRADIDYARAFDAINKIVICSHTLQSEGKNTKTVRANLKDEILKLKQEPGKNILTGGVNIPSQLIVHGLVDEYIFVIHPMIVGEGRRLFDGINLQERLSLKLVETTILKSSGSVALRYVRS